MKTTHPSELVRFGHSKVDDLIPRHPLPWKATILPPNPFGEGVWGLVDAKNIPVMECLDEDGARAYEKFTDTRFAE